MAKARDPNRDLAFEIYRRSKGNIDLVEIANSLNLPAGTIRGWKSKDKWDEKISGTFQSKTERSDKNMERSNKKRSEEKEYIKVVEEEVERVMENPKLTEKQRLFCLYFAKSLNATQSYKKAYGCSYETAMVEGCKSLRNPKIAEEIHRLKKARYTQAFLSTEDLVEKNLNIAFANLGDYLEFGTIKKPVYRNGKVVKVKGKDGVEKIATEEINYVRLKDSTEVDTSVIKEVRQGREGVVIVLEDKRKAIDWLTSHMDMLNEEQRARVAKLKAETQRINGDNLEIEDMDEIEGDIYGEV